jgi:uncharacterized RDD family membrane protein YckC
VITPFPTETATSEPEATEIVSPSPTPPPPPPDGKTGLDDWIIASLVSIGIGIAIYWFTTTFGLIRWSVRSGLLAIIGGLIAYSYIALGLPGSNQLINIPGAWGILLVTILGAGVGWGASYGWQKARDSS